MDFDLSADQEELRAAAGILLQRSASVERVREHVGPGADAGVAVQGFDRALWSAMAEQGWPAVLVPEERGGLGLGMVELAVLCEEIGRHVAPAPFLSTALVADALAWHAAHLDHVDDTRDTRSGEWAERLAAGEAVGAIAWAMSGRPDPVVFGPSADVVLVVTPDAVRAIEAGTDVARPTPEPAMDRTRTIGWLRVNGTPGWQVGGADASGRLVDRLATGLSAELLGATSRAMEMAVQYAKDRVQFKKPIGSFQAIKHRLADALVDVEGMRSAVYYAAWCTAEGDPDESLAASMAKAWCSDAAGRVLASSLQVHGGIGFTWEHDLHLYVKRVQLDRVGGGEAPWHRERIAGILQARMAEGHGIL